MKIFTKTRTLSLYRLLQQLKNKVERNVTVDEITYKDIPMNETQSLEHRDEELQRHQVIENRSIITIENQLTEFRKKQQEKFTKIKKSHVSPKSNENLHKWDRNTTLIVGDSMLSGLKKEKFQKGIERSKLKTSLELRSMTCTITSSHYQENVLII